MEKGAILICPFTDPGWTPVLDRVRGGDRDRRVIVARGGDLPRIRLIPCRAQVCQTRRRGFRTGGTRGGIRGSDGFVELETQRQEPLGRWPRVSELAAEAVRP